MRSLWPEREDTPVHLAMGGIALLLVILLLLTPVLESPSLGGEILNRAQLEVDVVQNGTFALYVDSNGHVRFSSISVAVALDLPSVTVAQNQINWTEWFNWTDRITTSVELPNEGQFAINVTTTYFEPGQSSPEYISLGVYAFQLSYGGGAGSLTAYPVSASLPSSASQSWPISSLPQTLVLAEKTVTVSGSSGSGPG